MEIKEINVNKANVHNLKGVSIKIPKNTLTVITGPSGSGKSSLAFDTIYVEGQRRYIESLSSYARQFLGQYQPPDVESITGLSPAIAIDQKSTSKNPRSTVGTITEIYDYFRVLFARVGDLYDPTSGELVVSYTPPQIARELLKEKEKTKIHIVAPLIKDQKGDLKNEINKFLAMGFTRARVDGEIENLDEIKLNKSKKHSLEIVIDRLVIKPGIEKRLNDSIEHALKLGNGRIFILIGDKTLRKYSDQNMSPVTEEVFPDLEPRLFSFNSPLGACSTCNGLGQSKRFDLETMILDDSLPVLEGAIQPLNKKNSFLYKMVESLLIEEGIDLKTPFNKIPKKIRAILIEGSSKVYTYKFKSENSHFEFKKPFPGITAWLDKKFKETGSERVRVSLEAYMKIQTCSDCNGLRLNPIALNTFVFDKHIMDFGEMNIGEVYSFIKNHQLTGNKAIIAEKLIKEITLRLKFLNDVGLNYLTLNRAANTLSGGEAQRIRLATQIGSALSGVLYVLDEPSIGLHQRDNTRLIKTLKALRDLGNTVLVVEHDEETMIESDFIVDLGPGAGIHGGEIVASGTPKQLMKNKKSITSRFLSGKECIPIPEARRELDQFIVLKKAKHNNLQEITVNIPLSGMVCVTGVSGSGKSTLIHEVLVPACKRYLSKAHASIYTKSNYQSISGVDKIKTIIELDQSPIGRTPNSNPATYSGLFDDIRKLYSKTPESQIRGYGPGRFSFNVKGGRCEHCEGNGVNKIEMHFLPDVYITCSECSGKRYNNETLSILYRGKHISDVLNMDIEEAHDFFHNHPRLKRILYTLKSVGLGYMKLGQPATTLSGGEAQRLKLSRELAKKTKGHCLYILDEPTTGLHFQDVKVLLKALDDLINADNSVLVIEHNLDVIKCADHIIDLGPEGGDQGGQIVCLGTPEELAKNKNSYTGRYLKKVLI
jgi:excinuclease ABC subunit A